MTDTNRYAPPTAKVLDISAAPDGSDIDSLPVSDGWKQRFRAIEKAGGPKLPKLKSLSTGERFKVSFNVLAFLFGPIYYASKGMWKKALSLFGVCFVTIIVVAVVLELVGLGRFANALGYGAAAIFGVRSNIDYYKKMVLGDDGWW